MRKSRFLAALIALFLAAALPLVSTSGAQAVSGHATVAAKAKTKVSIKFRANGAKSFELYGAVTPKSSGKNKSVKLYRATDPNGKFKQFKSGKTDGQGKYSFKGLKKVGYYYAKVGNAVSGVKHIFKN